MAEKINLETISYIFGILSIVMAFLNPIGGLIIGIIGLVQSNKLKLKKAKKLNVIGIVLSVVFFIIELIVLYVSTIGINGLFPSA